MNFHSSDRHKGPDGEPRWEMFKNVVLPGLYIRPLKETAETGLINVSIVVPSNGPYTGHFLQGECRLDELPQLLREYDENPEELVKSRFGWKPEEVKVSRVPSQTSSNKSTLSLADLGLE